MNHQTKRHCVIGAGFSGITTARKLKELGESFDILDANSGVGGLWHTGAYDSAHLVSSKLDTQFKDFPMPDSYPDFPGKTQVKLYIQAYSQRFGMAEHVQFNTYVNCVRPADDYGTTRDWFVEVEGETEPRRYATVAIANGHLSGMSAPRKPVYPGKFTGEIRYATTYRNANDFAGKRILVVGAGNTGCDIAVDSSRIADHTAISMRSGKHFIPKTFLGIPLSDLEGERQSSDWLDRLALRAINWLSFGSYERYGLPKPTHRILDKHPTINSQLLYQLQHGEIVVRREIKQYDGDIVEFVDGTREPFDIIMFAVGYDVSFPMIKPQDQVLEWEDRLPILFMGMMAPNYRGLFFAGLGQAQAGGGPLFQGGGDILARMMAKELRSDVGVMALIRNHSEAMRAGYNTLVEKLDMTSLKGHVVRASIRDSLALLDQIGCPDAPRSQVASHHFSQKTSNGSLADQSSSLT